LTPPKKERKVIEEEEAAAKESSSLQNELEQHLKNVKNKNEGVRNVQEEDKEEFQFGSPRRSEE